MLNANETVNDPNHNLKKAGATNEKLKYITSFDGVRALATLSVLALHGSYDIIMGGWIGVDVFFTLSGFLITSLLFKEWKKEGKINIRNFYIRRILRLTAPLLVVIALANILWQFSEPYTLGGSSRLAANLGAILYFTNLLNPLLSGTLAHLWSLSVEEHFYLMWPLLLPVFLRNGNATTIIKRMFYVVIFIFISKIIFEIWFRKVDFYWLQISTSRFTLFKIDGILLGAIVGIAFEGFANTKQLAGWFVNSKIAAILLSTSFILILLFLKETNSWLKHGGFIFIDFLAVNAILYAYFNPGDKLLTHPLLVWLGKRSYGIYVYHFPVFFALEHFRVNNDLFNLAWVTFARVGISISIAALSYQFIELPLLSLKKAFSHR